MADTTEKEISMADTAKKAPLVRLADTPLDLANPDDDVRGHKVLDAAGEEIGTVDDLMVDSQRREVRLLSISSGGFLGLGATTFLLPVEAVRHVDETGVHVSQTRERVAGAPPYDPKLVEAADWNDPYWGGLYGYYGFGPYWR